MRRATKVSDMIRKNWVGKQGFESWREFFDRVWRHGRCAVFGHAKTIEKMSGTVCPRCYVMVAPSRRATTFTATKQADGTFKVRIP